MAYHEVAMKERLQEVNSPYGLMNWPRRREESKRINFMAYHEVAMKGRQRNRVEFTSCPTMRWS
jgi:hypothetical protein